VTAAGVMRAIDPSAYEVVPIGITAGGRWVLADADPSRWELTGGVQANLIQHSPEIDQTSDFVVATAQA